MKFKVGKIYLWKQDDGSEMTIFRPREVKEFAQECHDFEIIFDPNLVAETHQYWCGCEDAKDYFFELSDNKLIQILYGVRK